jgi:hypothetical protein
VAGSRDPGWSEPSPSQAFAALDRNGRPYPAFYRLYIRPHAVLENGIVWCAYQDGQGRPLVMAYDVASRAWTGPVRASEHGLGRDTHGNPSICVDCKGHLHVFFGCHGRAMHHVKSARPYDMTEGVPMPHPTARATYPQTMRMADDRIFLFYRAGGHMEPWSMRISEDDGATWSEAERIVEMRLEPPDRMAADYCTFHPGADNRTVHCFFVHKDDNPTRIEPHPWRPLKYPGLHEAVYRYNIYYITQDAEGVWRAGGGTKLDLPVTKATADRQAMVCDTGHEFARPRRIVIDGENRPYIRFQEGVSDWTSGRVIVPLKTRYAALHGGEWKVTVAVPEEWPAQARQLIDSPGDPVAGSPRPSPWFIFEKRGLSDKGRATYVFLCHLEGGYAVRGGGPAWPPETE